MIDTEELRKKQVTPLVIHQNFLKTPTDYSFEQKINRYDANTVFIAL